MNKEEEVEMGRNDNKRKFVYIAGQYSTGDPAVNVNRAIKAADMIAFYGAVPFVPQRKND